MSFAPFLEKNSYSLGKGAKRFIYLYLVVLLYLFALLAIDADWLTVVGLGMMVVLIRVP